MSSLRQALSLFIDTDWVDEQFLKLGQASQHSLRHGLVVQPFCSGVGAFDDQVDASLVVAFALGVAVVVPEETCLEVLVHHGLHLLQFVSQIEVVLVQQCANLPIFPDSGAVLSKLSSVELYLLRTEEKLELVVLEPEKGQRNAVVVAARDLDNPRGRHFVKLGLQMFCSRLRPSRFCTAPLFTLEKPSQ